MREVAIFVSFMQPYRDSSIAAMNRYIAFLNKRHCIVDDELRFGDICEIDSGVFREIKSPRIRFPTSPEHRPKKTEERRRSVCGIDRKTGICERCAAGLKIGPLRALLETPGPKLGWNRVKAGRRVYTWQLNREFKMRIAL